MDFKNCAYNKYGSIDMEINHPAYGWIPFTASEDDDVAYGAELYNVAIEAGEIAPYQTPDIEQVRQDYPALTARQFWMAAANIDVDKDVILTAIKNNMADSVERKMTIAELESGSFDRLNDTVIDIMAMLDIPAEQVDNLWLWAARL